MTIQKDENDALKEALDATLQGKKEDFMFYQDIVEQTKQIFLQGLHQYRQTSAPKIYTLLMPCGKSPINTPL